MKKSRLVAKTTRLTDVDFDYFEDIDYQDFRIFQNEVRAKRQIKDQ